MLIISSEIQLPLQQIELSAIRAQGAGGQNVNKISSAIHLRFDIKKSSLSEELKQRLLKTRDSRINKDGIVIIKAQQFRTQEKNRSAALERLKEIILKAAHVAKTRKATKPSRNSKIKRMDKKTKQSRLKTLRKNVKFEE